MEFPKGLIRAVMDQYGLPRDGIHGPAHWARVLENGLRLVPLTGADKELVGLFALLHDSRREKEAVDRGHGRRAAAFARTLRGTHLHLDQARFDLLSEACALHTDGETEADVTVQTCWDADRLDLPRVGFTIDPQLLCTEAARDPQVIAWATGRAKSGYRSPIMAAWG